jgi:hypothetical protein
VFVFSKSFKLRPESADISELFVAVLGLEKATLISAIATSDIRLALRIPARNDEAFEIFGEVLRISPKLERRR